MPNFWRQQENNGRLGRDIEAIRENSDTDSNAAKQVPFNGEEPPQEIVQVAKDLFNLRPLLQEGSYEKFVTELDNLPETTSSDGY